MKRPISDQNYLFLGEALEKIFQHKLPDDLTLYVRLGEEGAEYADALTATTERELANAAAERRVATFFRGEHGGRYEPIPPDWWQIDDPTLRTKDYRLNPNQPFDPGAQRTHWIFVDRTDLNRLLQPDDAALLADRPDFELSPYLRFMVSLSRDLKISRDNQPTVESLQSDIEHRWPKQNGSPISARLSHAMATLLRIPDPQSIPRHRPPKAPSPQKPRRKSGRRHNYLAWGSTL